MKIISETIEHIHDYIEFIKGELAHIRQIIDEDYELSDKAKKALDKARKTSRSQYVSHEEVKKLLLK